MTSVRVRCPRRLLALALTLAALAAAPEAGAVPPGYTVVTHRTNLNFVTAFRFTPDGRLLYLERTGRVMVFENDADLTPGVWATLPTHAVSDRGLLGIAFHPGYPDSPYVYFYHSNPSPLVDRIVRLRDQGATGTGITIIRDNIPSTNDAHHGGRLAFAPDGTLWLTYGDQGSLSGAQDPANIRGKLLRFTSMGQDAPGNPYGPGMVLGVRNSFGICFDPPTGRAYFTDNGPQCDDELNLIVAGDNYGWGPDDVCGSQPAGTRLALASFTPPFAPTSCLVYRGHAAPALHGDLFFGGYVDGVIRRVRFVPSSGGTEVASIEVFHDVDGNAIMDLITGNDGKLWYATRSGIYRVDPPVPAAVPLRPPAPDLRLSPNPFVASLTIAGGLEEARVEILDLAGRRVRSWERAGGSVVWDGTAEDGRLVAPGLYRVRIARGGRVAEARVVRIAAR